MENQHPTFINKSQFNISAKNMAIFLGAILLFTSLIFYGFSQFSGGNREKTADENKQSDQPAFASSHTIIYGSWTNTGSKIIAYDLSTNTEYELATLPVAIKNVAVLSPTKLLYISDTDIRDYGREIVSYDLQTGETTALFNASEGFGIDEYVLSPNKEYIAIWEVQPNEQSGTLMGGKSRVFTGRLANPNQKNIIYDELVSESNPVRYARAILNDGTTFMDRFVPNIGSGWAYGMSISNFTGTQKNDISSMQNGTYGSQPVLSPDGRYLVFAGYDGSKGSGTTIVQQYRRALVSSNTIEMLDVSTLERIKIDVPSENVYSDVQWNDNSEDLVFNMLSAKSPSGSYTVNINSTLLTPLDTESSLRVLAILQDDTYLAGVTNSVESAIGNLGNGYEYPYSSFVVVSGDKNYEIPISATLAQFISVIPASELNTYSGVGIQSAITTQSNTDTTGEKLKLQLDTFVYKPSLAPVREKQQSAPPPEPEKPVATENLNCKDYALVQCNELFGVNYTRPQAQGIAVKYRSSRYTLTENSSLEEKYASCFITTREKGLAEKTCHDSPLYLYGQEGMKVKATIHTPIFDSNAKHTRNTYEVILGNSGSMFISGKRYEGITYNYSPAIRLLKSPTYGSIIKNNELEKTLIQYAEKLGLNEKETRDLVNDAKRSATGEYIFVSFYDHETSHAILPITFTPQPDVYRNIVFYFKNLDEKPNYSVQAPKFEKIVRKGFTAIEISHIAE